MKQKTKNIEPLSKEQLEKLDSMGRQFLAVFDSFETEDVVRFGRLKSPSFTREMILAWSDNWIQELVNSGKAEQVFGAYDYPIVRVKTLGQCELCHISQGERGQVGLCFPYLPLILWREGQTAPFSAPLCLIDISQRYIPRRYFIYPKRAFHISKGPMQIPLKYTSLVHFLTLANPVSERS